MKTFLNNRKGQNTAEYALLIALVVAGIIAMQTYAQRSLQARVRDASAYMTSNPSGTPSTMKATAQYEPYYSKSDYTTNRESLENKRLGQGLVAMDSQTDRTRAKNGYNASTYVPAGADAAGVETGL